MKNLLTIMLLLTIVSCKKEKTPEPQPNKTQSTICFVEFDNCPQGLDIRINGYDSLCFSYQLGTNLYQFKTDDSLSVVWSSAIFTTNFAVVINGITQVAYNNAPTIYYEHKFN